MKSSYCSINDTKRLTDLKYLIV